MAGWGGQIARSMGSWEKERWFRVFFKLTVP